MWAACLTTLLLAAPDAGFNPDAVNHRYAKCEYVEINTYYAAQGNEDPNFIQVIFWGNDSVVRGWVFYKKGFFTVKEDRISWKIGKLTYFVTFSKVVHTTTYFDPEIDNRKIVAQEARLYPFGKRLKQYQWNVKPKDSPFRPETP